MKIAYEKGVVTDDIDETCRIGYHNAILKPGAFPLWGGWPARVFHSWEICPDPPGTPEKANGNTVKSGLFYYIIEQP